MKRIIILCDTGSEIKPVLDKYGRVREFESMKEAQFMAGKLYITKTFPHIMIDFTGGIH